MAGAKKCVHMSANRSVMLAKKAARKLTFEKATTKGFEPSRAEPNGFRVHFLNHSDTLSWAVLCQWVGLHAVIKFVLFWMVHVIGCMFQLVDV